MAGRVPEILGSEHLGHERSVLTAPEPPSHPPPPVAPALHALMLDNSLGPVLDLSQCPGVYFAKVTFLLQTFMCPLCLNNAQIGWCGSQTLHHLT